MSSPSTYEPAAQHPSSRENRELPLLPLGQPPEFLLQRQVPLTVTGVLPTSVIVHVTPSPCCAAESKRSCSVFELLKRQCIRNSSVEPSDVKICSHTLCTSETQSVHTYGLRPSQLAPGPYGSCSAHLLAEVIATSVPAIGGYSGVGGGCRGGGGAGGEGGGDGGT